MADQAIQDVPADIAPAAPMPEPVQPVTVYTYSQETGEHTGESIARVDPLEPWRHLVPAGAVMDPPPAVVAGEEAARVGGAWVKRAKLAKVEPEGVKLTPAQMRAAQINARLDAIDKASARSLRESLLAQKKGKEITAFAVTKLEGLETEAAALRVELAGLK